MVDRRTVLLGAVGLAATPLLARRMGAAEAAAVGEGNYIGLYDAKLPHAREFADQLGRLGVPVYDTARDVARLLYGPLASWPKHPGTRLLGITGYADYVVVAGIAAERRRPVACAVMHAHGTGRLLAGTAMAAIPAALGAAAHYFRPGVSTPMGRQGIAWSFDARTES